MADRYTREAHVVNTQRGVVAGDFWVLMAGREIRAGNAVKALQTPENKGWRVFAGRLTGTAKSLIGTSAGVPI
jgi:hypothetical protein